MQRRAIVAAFAAALIGLFVVSKSSHAADDTIRIAYIDPLSGSFAQGADEDLQTLHYILDYVNAHEAPLGKKFELVTFDDKMQPGEALVALTQAIGQNIPIVMTQTGSHIAAAMIDAVAKNNQTNPEHRVLYLNGGSQATELTNEKCNFWHFRFAPNVQQIAYTRIKSVPAEVKKVYLLNQDYLYGRSVERDTKRLLSELRPDIEIVGDEFVPLLQLKDFAPHVNKVKQSGAQSLLTGIFASDLTELLKASIEGRLNIRFDTYLASATDLVPTVGAALADRTTKVLGVNENQYGQEHNAAAEQLDLAFRKDHKFGFEGRIWLAMFEMLSRAINEAGSPDPLKAALKLEGLQQKDMLGERETMRKDDHQLILSLYVGLLTHGVKYDIKGTGLGWKTIATVPAEELALPTTCKMERPVS